MKKILLVIAALFICVVAGAAVFLATFDADHYRPMLIQKASEALGAPIDLGHLSLVWKNGIAIRMENLTLYADAAKSAEVVNVRDLRAVVRLVPLLHKQVQV